MSNGIPDPRPPREKTNGPTTTPLISGETPERVKDLLATGGTDTSPIKKRPFYPLWYTRDLKNRVEKSHPKKSDIGDDCGELEE